MPAAQGGETKTLLKRLRALAKKPLAQATAMPREIYHSDEIVALEQRNIFEREWLCIGRAADIPKKGDYLTWRIGKQPVAAVRQADGSIRCFANVCRHRMMQLLPDRGTCNRIVCPYHAWTYDLKGQLVGAPYMERSEAFDKKSIRLPEVRTEVWQGWIYATLDDDATPVAEKLKRLEPVIERYGVADYVPIVLEDHEWDANWKLLAENFMEGYHLPVAHRNTVGGYFPADATEFDPDGPDENFTYQYFAKTEDAPVGNAHPSNTRLEGKWRHTSVLPTVFPSHMYALAPDHVWYLSIQPNGCDRVSIRYGAAVAPEVMDNLPKRSRFLKDTIAFLARVQEEDRFVVEGIHRGSAAPLSEAGPLSWLEHENHEFTQYIARRLVNGAAR